MSVTTLSTVSNGPLRGKCILITRPREQAGQLKSLLEAQGAEAIIVPTIQIVDPDDWDQTDRAIRQLSGYDWLIFTSGNGVDAFCQRLKVHGPGASINLKIGVVGRATAEKLAAWGWRADLVPDEPSTEGLLEAVPENLSGVKFLLPRGNMAGAALPEGLRQRGAVVDEITVYRTVMAESSKVPMLELLESASVDLVTFTSSSTVANFVRLIGEDRIERFKDRFLVASIGPKTSQTARASGLRVDIEATVATVAALVKGIVGYYHLHGGK
jgi:uroporphyrinogen III methyltransferase/synthase